MKIQSVKIKRIPTNIITGFLGVGKTSAIMNLLSSKPSAERWAILVNEFGEIGIDGSLIKGQSKEGEGIFVKEVPGGCMCCTAGLPMQVALAQLIRSARPDRLLIEPTGLGHPREVLETLRSSHFAETIDVQKIVTLIDARHLSDQRFATHQTYVQQLEIADVIIANKQDLYSDVDFKLARDYEKIQKSPAKAMIFTEHGVIDPLLLEGANLDSVQQQHLAKSLINRSKMTSDDENEIETPQKAINTADGFTSIGWYFDEYKTFNRSKLFAFLSGIDVIRVKATVVTPNGSWGYNFASGTLTEIPLEDCKDSRVEIIAATLDDSWEPQLFECLN